MAVLSNAFRGLCYLTTYTFFHITVNIWDNKGTKGPGIITYCENWPLNPNLCFLILTNHLSMSEPPLLFLRVLVLNSFLEAQLVTQFVPDSRRQQVIQLKQQRIYFPPDLILAELFVCWLCVFLWRLMRMCAGHVQLDREQHLPYAALKWLKPHRRLHWKLWNLTKLCINFVISKGTMCSE